MRIDAPIFTGSFSLNGSTLQNLSAVSTTGSNTFVGNQNVQGYISASALTGSIDFTNLTNSPTLVSGSSQVVNILSSLNTVTASFTPRITNLESKSASVDISITNINSVTASNIARLTNLESTSASVDISITNINSVTASNIARLNNLETKSASVDVSITNINSFTASNANTSLNSKTGSYATTGSNTFFGTQTYSGSVYIANDLIVQGSSSIQYISASSVSIGTNIVQLNTANPSVRFAGLTMIDSGSVGGSGSFLYDSLQDEFIFVHRGNGTNVTSSHFVTGPETYDSLGNETYLTTNILTKGTGKEHLIDSCIFDNGTTTCIKNNLVGTGTITGATIFGSTIACSPIGCFATSCATVALFTGCVGIGSVSPDAALHICCSAGSANALLAHFQNSGGGTAIATIKIGEGIPEGQYGVLGHYGADNSFRIGSVNGNLSFHAGASTACGTNLYGMCERLTILTSGNVGIGVTPSAWSGITALQIGGYASFGGDSSFVTYVSSNAYYNAGWKYIGVSAAANYYQDSGAHYFRSTSTTGTAGGAITWINPLTIASTGAATFSSSVTAGQGTFAVSSGDNLILEKPTGAYLSFKNGATLRGSINGNNGTDGINLNYGASHTTALAISSTGTATFASSIISSAGIYSSEKTVTISALCTSVLIFSGAPSGIISARDNTNGGSGLWLQDPNGNGGTGTLVAYNWINGVYTVFYSGGNTYVQKTSGNVPITFHYVIYGN